jgi:hypothetical protein
LWAHFSYFIEGRRKDENKRPQAIRRQQISKTVSPATWPPRSAARVQHVALQFGKGSGMHLPFASAARESLVMKRETLAALFPSHSGGRGSSVMDQCRQDRPRFRTAPAMHRVLVRIANRFRSITSAPKKAITRQPKHHGLDLARGGASGGGAGCAEMPLQTEQVASFADVCSRKRSNLDSSATKPGTW